MKKNLMLLFYTAIIASLNFGKKPTKVNLPDSGKEWKKDKILMQDIKGFNFKTFVYK